MRSGACGLLLAVVLAGAAAAAEDRPAAAQSFPSSDDPRWEEPFGPVLAACRPADPAGAGEAPAACKRVLQELIDCPVGSEQAFWRAYDVLAAELPDRADPARSIRDVVDAMGDEAALCDPDGGTFLWHSYQSAEEVAPQRAAAAFDRLLAAAARATPAEPGSPQSIQFLPPPGGPALLVLAGDACAPDCHTVVLRCRFGRLSGAVLDLDGTSAGKWLSAGDALRLLGGGERLSLCAGDLERDDHAGRWRAALRSGNPVAGDRLARLGAGPDLAVRLARGTAWTVPFADADRAGWAAFAEACREP